MSNYSMSVKYKDLRILQMIPNFMKNQLMPLLLQFGRIMMLRRAFSVSYSVVAVKNFLRVVVGVSEEKLTFSYVETLQQQNHNFYSMCIKQRLEEYTHQAKVHLQLVLQYTSQKTQRLKRSYQRVAHWFYLIEAYVASMSLTRWMTALVSYFMKQWSNRLFLLLKQV